MCEDVVWHLHLECKRWFSSSGALSKSCYYLFFVKLLSQVPKFRAQVLSGSGATFSKELHLGVYFACPLTHPAHKPEI